MEATRDTIDRINILAATLQAMSQAVHNLPLTPSSMAVLVDGNQRPGGLEGYHVTCVVGGDRTCYSVAAASILAKVRVGSRGVRCAM